MATVRQSITALYEESQKSALEGAPMLAILQSETVESGSQPAAMSSVEIDPETGMETDIEAGREADAPAIAARFDELRHLAEIEAGSDMARHAGETPNEEAGPADELPPEHVIPPKETFPDVPIIEIPSAPFGPGPDTAPPPGMAQDDDPRDAARDDMNGRSVEPTLPDEPPAPATGDALGDLDIGDIQDLVRQAWEDETAIGDAAQTSEESPAASEDTGTAQVDASHDPALSGGIEMAMEEIAAAVVQSADTGPSVDVEAMKADIIGAMRAELQAVVESDLRAIVKAAVAEAMAEMPVAVPAATPKKAPAKKAAAKKAATKTSAAKKAANKTAAKAAPPDDGGDS